MISGFDLSSFIQILQLLHKRQLFIKLLHFEPTICKKSSKLFKYVYSLNYFVINFFALSHMQIWWSRNCITYLKGCIISSGNSSAKCNFMEEVFVKLTFSSFFDLQISFSSVKNMEHFLKNCLRLNII